MALVACPTGSIGTQPLADASAGVAAFPERIADDIFFNGFASGMRSGRIISGKRCMAVLVTGSAPWPETLADFSGPTIFASKA